VLPSSMLLLQGDLQRQDFFLAWLEVLDSSGATIVGNSYLPPKKQHVFTVSRRF